MKEGIEDDTRNQVYYQLSRSPLQKQFTEEILTEATKRYDINNDTVRLLGGMKALFMNTRKTMHFSS